MSTNLLVRLAQTLDSASLPYMIIGGQAVLLYGEPRLTRDVDVTLGATPQALDQLLSLIPQIPLRVLVEQPEEFVHQTWVLPTLDEVSGLRVDFIFSWTPYEQQALQRVRSVPVNGYPVRFASPEDVIIHKLLAARPRDLEDVASILRKQPIDAEYIRRWLDEFDRSLGGERRQRFEALLAETRNEP